MDRSEEGHSLMTTPTKGDICANFDLSLYAVPVIFVLICSCHETFTESGDARLP